MKRLLSCAAALSLLAAMSAAPSYGAAARARVNTGSVSGTVVGVAGDTFTIQTAGRRMGVINALIASANAVTQGDYPYVWGGGHAQAGVASIGIPGPGHNGRRRGFDCSGSVAAVLAGAGLWPAGGGVPGDAGVISQLLSERLIARGAGRAPVEVTLYDHPGIHIFMNIDGRFFGTSDGAGGGNSRGGAGWLYDGAWDATNPAFKQYHFLPAVLRDSTTYGHDFTFTVSGGVPSELAGELALGDRVSVGYVQNGAGGMTATSLAWSGALTAGGTLISLAPDGSSFTVQLPSGQLLTLSTGGFAWLLQGVAPGDGVRVTYTAHRAVLTARMVQSTGTAVTGSLTGVISSVASDGSALVLQVDGQTLTLGTGGVAGLLDGLATGQTVTVSYFRTASGALVAQQVGPAGGTPQASGAAAAPAPRRSR